jgi:hypothetical protein
VSARAADEPLPGFTFRVSWADRQIASISSVSALRLDTGAGEQMLPGPVEFARARSGDDAFEVWAADPAPRAVTVAVLDACGASSLTFVLEDAVPVSYTALDGLDADSADTLRERLVVRCRAIRRVPTSATGRHPQELLPRPMRVIRPHSAMGTPGTLVQPSSARMSMYRRLEVHVRC